jgi:hypothetical protein
MPRVLGKDKSTLPRGLKKTRVEYGKVGHWQGIPVKVMINDEICNTFVLATEEKLHVMLVPAWCREEVFQTMNSTWSWSKHLASKLVVDAVLLSPKPMIWHHGMVTPTVIQGQIKGYEESHAERLKKSVAPWIHEVMEIPTHSRELAFRL